MTIKKNTRALFFVFFSCLLYNQKTVPQQKLREKILRGKSIKEVVQSKTGLLENLVRPSTIAQRYETLRAVQKTRAPLAKEAPHLKYHQAVWVAAHNSFASHFPIGKSGKLFNYYYAQQGLSLEDLLNVGVRILDLDTYLDTNDQFKKNEIYLAHGGLKVDRLLRAKPRIAPRTLYDALVSITRFLENNPDEIVTLSFENYVPIDLFDAKILSVPGIQKLILKPEDWSPASHAGWPELGWLVKNNKRLILFNDKEKTSLAYHTWGNFAATGFGNLDINYLASNLRSKPDENRALYLFAAILIPSAPFPIPPKGNFLKQANYVVTHLHEIEKNIDFEKTNSVLLNQFINLLKERYGRIPTAIFLDHVELGNALQIAAHINQQSASNEDFRNRWFGAFPKGEAQKMAI